MLMGEQSTHRRPACTLRNQTGWAASLAARAVLGLFILTAGGTHLRGETVRIGSNAWPPGAESVAVTGEALLHTAQILPTDSSGRIPEGGAAIQAERALNQLQAALAAGGAQLSDVVKLNLYVRNAGSVAQVLNAVEGRFEKDARPAIGLVETTLPDPAAEVALDAVARRSPTAAEAGVRRHRIPDWPGSARGAQAALLPAGPRVYISGQAAQGDDLREAAALTLQRLQGTLEFLGLGLPDVVQVKTFLKPMAAAGAVSETIEEFFGGDAPPMAFVEWGNAEPLEIELVAAGKKPRDENAAEPLKYLTPPGETASPVFSRVAWLDHPTTIYFSTFYGDEGDGVRQIHSAFGQLEAAARRAGSDLRHLVKATYYVTNEDVSRALTDIRRGLYDPKRPPAASKATVSGVGVAGRAFTLDMIAAPARDAARER